MDVILLQDIPKVGKKYDVKRLTSGHVRNFLLPRRLVELATPESAKRIEGLKQKLVKEREEHARLAADQIKALAGTTLVMKAKANAEGHLFAGIGKEQIIEALAKKGITLTPEQLELGKPVKQTGTFPVGNFTLVIEAEKD